jgi:hypothetical protein
MQKWEYLVLKGRVTNVIAVNIKGIWKSARLLSGGETVYPRLGEYLNDLGQQGWELVSTRNTDRLDQEFEYVFKRLLEGK